jgi:lysophospholipase L1-like esterase
MDIRLRARGRLRRRRIAVGGTVLASALGLGLAGLPAPAVAATTGPVVVGFGDSVPTGLHCGCTNFIQQYATAIGGTADNLAQNGSTSLNLVHLLQTARAWKAVENASVVVIMTGANDYNSAFYAVSNGASPSRYTAVTQQVKANVTTAVNKIRSINPKADVVIVDYWAAMEAGKVAQQNYNAATQKAALESTEAVDGALWAVAQKLHTDWLSTFQLYYRPGIDVTSLLASDGNHPDAAGTALIATALNALLPVTTLLGL